MNRRALLLSAAAALALAVPAAAAGAPGKPHVEYSRDAYEKARAGGEPLLLDFFAEW